MPVTVFGSVSHERAVAAVRARFPGAEVLDASALFADSADWRRRWPRIVRTLDYLVFIADANGVIGAGVFQEVLDARFHGVRVEYLTARGAFQPIEDVGFWMLAGGDRSRFAEVRVSRGR